MRSTREVLEDHLEKAKQGLIDEDLAENYSDDTLFLTSYGVFHGRAGARRLADILIEELPDQRFDYETILVEGEYGFLIWTGSSEHSRVPFGTDTYVIRDGRIVMQSFHYVVEEVKDTERE